MEITAHGFVMRSGLRRDVERQIGRLVQGLPRPIKRVAVDLVDEHRRTLRDLNKLCRVHVEFLDDACDTVADAQRDFRAAIEEAFLQVLRRCPTS